MYQTLWLNGIGLLEWLEHKMYLTKQWRKAEKQAQKLHFSIIL